MAIFSIFNSIQPFKKQVDLTKTVMDRLAPPDYDDANKTEEFRLMLWDSWHNDIRYIIICLMQGGQDHQMKMAKMLVDHMKLMTSRAREHIEIKDDPLMPQIENLLLK